MSSPLSPSLEAMRRREAAVEAFASAWRAGEAPVIESRLEGEGEERAALLLELALADLEGRARRGWASSVELYLRRFPELAAPEALTELVRREWQLRAGAEPERLREDYRTRFPELRGPLSQMKAPPAREASLPSAPTLPPAAGETLALPNPGLPGVPGYEVEGELGRGGMGVVYRARQLGLNRVVALKMILSATHVGPDERARFRREGEAIAGLRHPNVVQVYHFGEHNGQPFFSLELCAGGSLEKRLAGSPLPPREAAALVARLAGGLEAAHQARVVHRDLKPANVLLDADDTPKVTDFGLAKKLDEAGHTHPNALMGTPAYMAPEQARGQNDVGPLADVWALGAILYECLTGRPPFKAASAMDTLELVLTEEPVAPTRLNKGVPLDLETVALKCLRKEPGQRYGSAKELGDDLGRWLEGRPITARPVGAAKRAWKWAKRRPAVAGLTAAVAVLLVAGTSVSTALAIDARQERDAALESARTEAIAKEGEGMAKVDAQKKAKEAKDNLELSEKNFALARKAVNDTFGIAKDDPLLTRPSLSPALRQLRRKLLEKALPFYQQFQVQRPGDQGLSREMFAQHMRVGFIQNELGNRSEALLNYRKAEVVIRQLVLAHPRVPKHVDDLAILLTNLGLLQRDLGQRDAARASHQEAVDLGRRLWQEQRREQDRARLADALNALGVLLQQMGKGDEALVSWHEAASLRRHLVKAQPGKPTYLSDLGATLINLATVDWERGRREKALTNNTEAVELLRRLVRVWPGVPEYQVSLVQGLNNLGVLLKDMGRTDEALRSLTDSAQRGRALVGAHGDVPAYKDINARTLTNLGDVQRAIGQRARAMTSFREAAVLRRQLVNDFPRMASYRNGLMQIVNALGVSLWDGRQLEEARQTLVEAVGLGRQLVKEDPQLPVYQNELVRTLTNLGLVQRDLARTGEAIDSLSEAANRGRWLVAHQPKVAEYWLGQVKSLVYRGRLLRQVRRVEEVRRDLDEALTVLTRLQRIDPGNPDLLHYLRNAHMERAASLENLGKHRLALRDWDRLLAIARADEVVNVRFDRMFCLARAGEHDRAAAEAAAFARLPRLPARDLYDLARVFSICARGRDPSRPLPLADRRSEERARAAVALLRRAADAAFFIIPPNVARLDKDADLDPVRARDYFKRFRAALAKK